MLSAIEQSVNAYQFMNSVSRNQSDSAATAATTSAEAFEQTGNRQGRTLPGQDETNPDGSRADSLELSREAEEIRELQMRDAEVRAHEAAHAAAGGAYAGSPTYTFKRGPDGRTYATGGEVSINISPVQGDPQATLQKAQQVRAAALAPAEPSSQDMKVAQKAQSMAAKARMEISNGISEDTIAATSEKKTESDSDNENDALIPGKDSSVVPTVKTTTSDSSGIARLSIYS